MEKGKIPGYPGSHKPGNESYGQKNLGELKDYVIALTGAFTPFSKEIGSYQ